MSPEVAGTSSAESAQTKVCKHCSFNLSDGKLTVHGIPVLSEVPANVFLSSFSSVCMNSATVSSFPSVAANAHRGAFLGFDGRKPSSRVLNPLGKLRDTQFMSIFRFKVWWSTVWLGRNGSDLQMETQLLLLDTGDAKASYVLILPVIEGSFRSALHPGTDDNIDVSVESGSRLVQGCGFKSCVYLHCGNNPYDLMREAYTAMRVHLDSFRLSDEKSVPEMVDRFGWCTWDALYLTVDPVGVWHGIRELVDGGCPPRFLIIDDGWQSINLDHQNPLEDAKDLVLGGSQMTCRLYRFGECDKFKNYRAGTMLSPRPPKFDREKHRKVIEVALMLERDAKNKALHHGGRVDHHGVRCSSDNFDIQHSNHSLGANVVKGDIESVYGDIINGVILAKDHDDEEVLVKMGMKAFIDDLRVEFKGLDDVYVWHALCGAWGGVRPGVTHLDSKIIRVNLSPGLNGMMEDLGMDKIVEGGIGVVHLSQASDLYDSMHSYLARVGITGVKVDVIHTLEFVCDEYGGRVEMARAYYEGLNRSVAKNFNGNGLIASMQQCNDFFFLGTKQISMGRVGDDFWFQDPNGDPMGAYWLQGVHLIHCGYNSLWMGNFIRPDWDMFQSDHVCAKFHAASRAICGGPIYVSDSIGRHDFDLLRKLVLPDGTILRCRHYALPTRDCIFRNPTDDGTTMLKLWNLNKFGGVIGAFNCQGAGWCPEERRIKAYSHFYKPICGFVSPGDVEWNQRPETASMGNAEEYAVYLNQSNKLIIINPEGSYSRIEITLQPSCFEIFTIVPVKIMSPSLKFAAIGLVNMYNSGGAIEGLRHGQNWVEVQVKGGGIFCAYSSQEPKGCEVNGERVPVQWGPDVGSDGNGSCDGTKVLVEVPWTRGGLSTLRFMFDPST